MNPILRWVGRKTDYADQIIEYFSQKIDILYVPFAGGLGVAYRYAQLHPQVEVVANDVNERLIGFYNLIKFQPDMMDKKLNALSEQYNKADMNERENLYYHWREMFREGDDSLLYALNKTGFNALYRENKKGVFNVAWGKRKTFPMVDIFEHSRLFQKFTFHSKRFQDFVLNDCAVSDRYRQQIYCDPPYLTDGFKKYDASGFSMIQHQVLAVMAAISQLPFAISGRFNDNTRGAYSVLNIITIPAKTKVSPSNKGRGAVTDLLAVNDRS